MYFRYFAIISPWKRGVSWIPITQECFVLSLVEIGPVVLSKKIFFKFRQLMCFCYFVIIVLHLNKLESLYPRMLCTKFLDKLHTDFRSHISLLGFLIFLASSGTGEEDEHVKSLQCQRWQRRQTTDKYWSEKITWAFRSGELKSMGIKATTRRARNIENLGTKIRTRFRYEWH